MIRLLCIFACFLFVGAGQVTGQIVAGGRISLPDGDTVYVSCLSNSDNDIIDLIIGQQAGEQSKWILTSGNGTIIQVNNGPPYQLSNIAFDTFYINHISYSASINGLSIGLNIANISGEFSLSNKVSIFKKLLTKGNMITASGASTFTFCSGDGIKDLIPVQTVGQNGSSNVYVFYSKDSIILGVINNLDTIDSEALRAGLCYVQQLTFEPGVRNLEVGLHLSQISGCHEWSFNRLTIEKRVVDGGNLCLKNGKKEITLCVGDGKSDAFTPIITDTLGPIRRYVITDTNDLIIVLLNTNVFNLEGEDAGKYKIYHISYYAGTTGLSPGGHLSNINGCYDLSNPIAITLSEGKTTIGTLSIVGNNMFCNGDGKPDSLQLANITFSGQNIAYLIMDKDSVVLAISNSPNIDLEGLPLLDTVYVIALVFQNETAGIEVGAKATKIEGCYNLSNRLPIYLINVNAGTIAITGTNEITICSNDNVPDVLTIDNFMLRANNFQLILVDKNGIILKTVLDQLTMDVDLGLSDTSFLYLVAYSGVDVSRYQVGQSLGFLSGCIDISHPITIINNSGLVIAATPFIEGGTKKCVVRDEPTSISILKTSTTLGVEMYVVVDIFDQVVISSFSSILSVNELGDGNYSGFILASVDSLLPAEGSSISDKRGCYDISPPFNFEVQHVNAGIVTLGPSQRQELCLGDNIDDFIDISVNNSEGDFSRWIITDTLDNIITALIGNPININTSWPNVIIVRHIAYNDNLVLIGNLQQLSGCYDISSAHTFILKKAPPVTMKIDTLTEGTFIYCDAMQGDTLKLIITPFVQKRSVIEITNSTNQVLGYSEQPFLIPSLYNEDTIFIRAISAASDFIITDTSLQVADACVAFSKRFTIINQSPVANLTVQLPQSLCLLDSIEQNIPLQTIPTFGVHGGWIVSNINNEIVASSNADTINTKNLPEGILHLSAIASFSSIDFDKIKTQGNVEGCIDQSTKQTFEIIRLSAGIITALDGSDSTFVCTGQDSFRILSITDIADEQIYVLTTLDGIIISTSNTPVFSSSSIDTGKYLVYKVVGRDLISTVLVGIVVTDLTCASLSKPVFIQYDESTITSINIILDTLRYICENGVSRALELSSPDVDVNDLQWIVTRPDGIIEKITPTLPLLIEESINVLVYGIAFGGLPAGLVVGADLTKIRGCFGLSYPLVINAESVDPGIVTWSDGSEKIDVCGIGISTDTLYPKLETTGANKSLWIVTDTFGFVQDTFLKTPIIIDNQGPLVCRVYHLAYSDRTFLPTIDSLLDIDSKCFHLSNHIEVTKSLIRGGKILVNGKRRISICVGGPIVDQINYTISAASGDGVWWIVANNQDIIEEVALTPPTNFSGYTSGISRIYQLRYNPGMFSVPDVGSSVSSIDGCFELSDSVLIDKSVVSGGFLSVKDTVTEVNICIDDEKEEAVSPNLTGAEGADMTWVLTDLTGIIISASTPPPYTFEGSNLQDILIWSLSKNGIVQGLTIGKNIYNIEGCYDLSNPFRVKMWQAEGCIVSAKEDELEKLYLYPNPTNSTLNISESLPAKSTYKIFDILGRINAEGILNDESNINISSLSSGHYRLLIHTPKGQAIRNFVKY